VESLAKISRPRLPRVYDRARLFRRLDAGRAHRALWIAGLPGAGKTTLVASWIARRRFCSLWYQVDAGDADVASFFYYLGLAARSAARGRITLPAFTPEYRGGLGVFSRRFFREVARHLSTPAVLAFDNVHEVPSESQLHDALACGIEELPAGVSIVLVSRAHPPAALARLHAYGELVVVEADELRLSGREAYGIARGRGARIGRARAVNLAARADGWTAGLVLLLERPGDEVPAAAASPRALFDFFAGEVLARTRSEERDVLLATALLPHTTGHAAKELSGNAGAPEILAALAERGFFTVTTGPDRYQYHPLFREFLLARARDILAPARLASLRGAAARALEDEEHLDEAVALLRADGTWDEVTRVAHAHAPALVSTGRGQTLLRWVDAVPLAALERAPALILWLGHALLGTSPSAARRWYVRAFELYDESDDAGGMYQAWSAVVGTYVWEWSDFTGLDRWIAALEDLERRHPLVPGEETSARVALAALAALVFHRPEHPSLPAREDQAFELAMREAVPLEFRVAASTYLIVYDGWFIGDPDRARRLVEVLAPRVRAPDVDPLTAIMWRSGEAPYHWNVGAAGPARRATEEGLQLARDSGIHVWDFMLHLQSVWAALAADEVDAGRVALERVGCALDAKRPLQLATRDLAAALLALRRCDWRTALTGASAAGAEYRTRGYGFGEALARLAAARALGELRRSADARAELEVARGIGAQARSAYFRYSCALAAARLAIVEGQENCAVEPLRTALGVARERGLTNHLWFTREETAELCAVAIERAIEPAEARRLATARACAPPARAFELAGWPWRLEVATLGGLDVRRDGKPIACAARANRRQLQLLVVLLTAGPEGLAEERVEELLWSDADGDSAHHALETTLYRLRRLLGSAEALVQRDRCVRIDRSCCFVDAWAVERRLARGLALLDRDAATSPAELARVASEALDLYRAPFLPRVDAPWSVSYRAQLERTVERLLREVALRLRGGGDVDAAARLELRTREVTCGGGPPP
jgi:hypothetical protein